MARPPSDRCPSPSAPRLLSLLRQALSTLSGALGALLLPLPAGVRDAAHPAGLHPAGQEDVRWVRKGPGPALWPQAPRSALAGLPCTLHAPPFIKRRRVSPALHMHPLSSSALGVSPASLHAPPFIKSSGAVVSGGREAQFAGFCSNPDSEDMRVSRRMPEDKTAQSTWALPPSPPGATTFLKDQ